MTRTIKDNYSNNRYKWPQAGLLNTLVLEWEQHVVLLIIFQMKVNPKTCYKEHFMSILQKPRESQHYTTQ